MTTTTNPLHPASGPQTDETTRFLVDALIAADLDLTARDRHGNTWLHLIPQVLSFLRANPSLTAVFADRGAEVNAKNEKGETALHLAAATTGSEADLEALLAAGADSSARNETAETPMHYAAGEAANAAAVRILAAAGADCDARDKHGRTPLHRAASCGNREIVETLLGVGAAVNARNEEDETPLHVAIGESREVIRALLAAGAEIEARHGVSWPFGVPGMTALHLAVLRGETEAVRELLAAGANPGTVDSTGRPALHTAAADCKDPEIITALLGAGAQVGARGKRRETPLHRAARSSESPEVISALVAAGASIYARDDDGATPLHWGAASNRHAEVIAALVSAGAPVNARDDYGETPLHCAAVGKSEEVVATLLAAGGDFDLEDSRELTPRELLSANPNLSLGRLATLVGGRHAVPRWAGLWNELGRQVIEAVHRADGAGRRHYRALLLVATAFALWPHAC